MRLTWIIVFLTVLPLTAAAQNAYTMQIDNVQEQAAGNCLVGSTAQGSGTATFDPSTNTLSWDIEFGNNAPDFDNGLLDQGGELFAHFHAAAPGVNGPVRVTLNNGTPKTGSAVLAAAQVTELQSGLFYVNIHSAGCGPGEIRGQVLEAEVPAMPLWGYALGALAVLAASAAALRRGANAS